MFTWLPTVFKQACSVCAFREPVITAILLRSLSDKETRILLQELLAVIFFTSDEDHHNIMYFIGTLRQTLIYDVLSVHFVRCI
jgi:hypothetical protein